MRLRAFLDLCPGRAAKPPQRGAGGTMSFDLLPNNGARATKEVRLSPQGDTPA